MKSVDRGNRLWVGRGVEDRYLRGTGCREERCRSPVRALCFRRLEVLMWGGKLGSGLGYEGCVFRGECTPGGNCALLGMLRSMHTQPPAPVCAINTFSSPRSRRPGVF